MKALVLAALIFAVLLAPVAKAESIGAPTTWDYTFSTDFAMCSATFLPCISTSGHVVFTLELVTLDGSEPNRPCVNGGWEEVVGMTGDINGNSISFSPQSLSNCGADQLFPPSAQQGLMRPAIASSIMFAAGGLNWNIFAPDMGPYASSVLLNNSGGQTAVINWELTDPPVSTPEPGSFAMAGLGLTGLFLLARMRRPQARNI